MKNDAETTLALLTTEEKAALVTGGSYWATAPIGRLNIPSIVMSDGPNGLRKQAGAGDNLGLNNSVEATCFPTESMMAATFDSALLEKVGEAIAEECRSHDVNVLLGPGINIKRHPVCGRNFEYMSEDPLVAGKLGAAYIKGVQKKGVGVCLKHFAANSQEKGRMISDSVVDSRALRELYLKGFEIAVKESDPWSVMGAYNKLNGVYACENAWLLKQVLRQEWGFQGAVITDWGGMSSQAKSYQNGLSLEMPGIGKDRLASLIASARNGEIAEEDLNHAALDVLNLIDKATQTPNPKEKTNHQAEHLQLAQKVAAEGAVLLKNNDILPIDKTKSIAIIGSFARTPRYQGAGSSKINTWGLVSVCQSFDEAQIPYEYAKGYEAESTEADAALISEAIAVAKGKDVVLLFAGLPDSYESEGYDREHMELPRAHNELIQAVLQANPNTAVILMCGSPVELPWADEVPAILLAYLGGCQGGHALRELLTGEVNPSGKLAETWPLKKSDVYCDPIYPECPRTLYKESIYVGYRYYDTVQKAVRFPFGHGLSYSSFCYESMIAELRGKSISLRVRVKNNSSRTGSEVVQIYTSLPKSAVPRPAKELRAFQKVNIDAGASCEVEFNIPCKELAYYSIAEKRWILEAGDYQIFAAASSRDIRLTQTLHIEGEAAPNEPGSFYKELPLHVTDISDDMFEEVYGEKLPEATKEQRPFSMNATLADVSRETTIGKILSKAVDGIGKKTFGTDMASQKMFYSMKYETPLRGLSLAGMQFKQIEGLLELCNGHYLKGLKELLQKR